MAMVKKRAKVWCGKYLV